MQNRITPEKITRLEPNHVFVYGANEAGIHGAGAARLAVQRFGAVNGCTGFAGQSYGIPTKDGRIETLPTDIIQYHVLRFVAYARRNPDQTFLVTEIGCGLAGYEPKDIAPLFASAVDVINIYLPKRFWQELLPQT